MNNMTALVALTLIASAVAPFIVALFTRPDMSASTKRLIAAGVAIVLGLLTAIVTGQVSWATEAVVNGLTNTLITIGIVMTLAQGFYNQFKDAVKQVEEAAHPVPEPEPDTDEPEEEFPEPVDEVLVEETDPTEGEVRTTRYVQ